MPPGLLRTVELRVEQISHNQWWAIKSPFHERYYSNPSLLPISNPLHSLESKPGHNECTLTRKHMVCAVWCHLITSVSYLSPIALWFYCLLMTNSVSSKPGRQLSTTTERERQRKEGQMMLPVISLYGYLYDKTIFLCLVCTILFPNLHLPAPRGHGAESWSGMRGANLCRPPWWCV